MRAKVAIPLVVTAGVVLSVMSMNALGIKHPADAAEPTAKPASGCSVYTNGIPDEKKMGPYVQDWMNAHPVDEWPKDTMIKTEVNIAAATDLVVAGVFVPMGCPADDDVLWGEAWKELTVGWAAWNDAQPQEPAKPGPSDSDHSRCRMSFGTGGFHWSCSVSTS